MKNYHKADSVRLIHSGKEYFDVLERLIRGAHESFHLQTYIFDYDDTGKHIVELLIEAAKRQVMVFVLVDAFGSNSFPARVVKKMQQAGIHFRFFSPLFSSEGIAFGRRLHHKIAIADRRHGMIGGINIADKYNVGTTGYPWLDYAVLIDGEVCSYLYNLCDRIYKKKKPSRRQEREGHSDMPEDKGIYVRFRRNDWLQRKKEIHKSYLEALILAEKSIVLVASYFLPGRTFRKLLKQAAERGVEIKILLAGKSDIPVFRMAENYLYNFYLRNKISIYQWTNSVMHGKAMSVDGKWITVGSYNLNYLSQYISIELNVDIFNRQLAQEFDAHIQDILENHSNPVNLEIRKRSTGFFSRMKMALGYAFYRMVMSLMMSGKHRRERTIVLHGKKKRRNEAKKGA